MGERTTDIKADLTKIQWVALAVGVLAAAACGYGYTILDHRSFYTSYLAGFILVLGLPLGSLGWLMIQHMVNGQWGYVIRRMLEVSIKTLPLLALMFVPVYFGMHDLYVWTHPEHIHEHEVLGLKTTYLNHDFFVARAVGFFVIVIALAGTLAMWSRRQDRTADADLSRKMCALSAPGILIYATAGTFAMFDWMMSLEPAWFSTIYGVHALVGMGLTTLAFMAILLHFLSSRGALQGLAGPQQFHDIGNLMFTFTILWTYMNVGQLIIIWSGNLPEENVYFLARIKGSWRDVAIFLTLFQFAVPFFLLLMRNFKRKSAILARIALLVILVRIVDYHWLIAPPAEPEGIAIHWMDFAAPVAMFGIWLAVFIALLKQQPLLPLHDPEFEGLLRGEKHEELGWEVADEL